MKRKNLVGILALALIMLFGTQACERFDEDNLRRKNREIERKSDCIDESKITRADCPKVREPVCGCNGVTYPNRCYANAAGVTKMKPGACPTKERENDRDDDTKEREREKEKEKERKERGSTGRK